VRVLIVGASGYVGRCLCKILSKSRLLRPRDLSLDTGLARQVLKTRLRALDDVLRPLQNAPFCPITASGSNFNPRNTQCIPPVKIFAFLELEQN
jgi:hypothetical protein